MSAVMPPIIVISLINTSFLTLHPKLAIAGIIVL